jgi:hypothetical protein
MAGQPKLSFEELHARLVAGLGTRGLSDLERGTIVVVPSITFPVSELRKIVGIQYYEERLLCVALLLRNPDVRMVYVTSMPIDEAVVDYYLSFVPDDAHARRRLELVTLDDPEPRALSAKLLERPDALAHIRGLVDSDDAYILPFNVSHAEREVAEALGVPLYGPHPDLVPLGSKTGSRRVARWAGVPVPAGTEDLWSLVEVERALEELQARRPDAATAVIKLNNGFSGQGNAIVDLSQPVMPLVESATYFCASEESWPSFESMIAAEGAIVEEMVANDIASPSVQLRISPDGSPELVSTHDQILGGPDDQVYLGCRFPARSAYRTLIQEQALAVAEVLASKGVIGSFGIDFVIVEGADGPESYLSEINLRMGGTTHPFLMARFATEGTYDAGTGRLVAGDRPKYYVASDNLKSEAYVGLDPASVIATVAQRGLAYDAATKTGAMLHLLGALKHHGKMGTTCIGDSRAEANDLYEQVSATVDELGKRRA